MDASTPSWLVGQGWVQLGELGLAFVLASLIGLERELRGKHAGLRTQSIVGVAAALTMIVSKYGFFDVVGIEGVSFDPSRVAAGVLTGIGFIGAGLILARNGVVHGLTTAAAVWITAAIGLASGSGLWLIAIAATLLYFISVIGYTQVVKRLPQHHADRAGSGSEPPLVENDDD